MRVQEERASSERESRVDKIAVLGYEIDMETAGKAVELSKDSIQQQAYDLFITVSTGLFAPEIIRSRLENHLGLRGFPTELSQGRDILKLSDDAAQEAMKILPRLYHPRPGAKRLVKLI